MRRLLAFLLLIVGLVLLVFVGWLYIQQQNQPAPSPIADGSEASAESTPVVAAPDETFVEVVVSVQTVPRGFQMTENELAIDLRLASEVTSNTITNLDDAIGLYARTDIYQGQTLTEAVLTDDPRLEGEDEYGPSSLIPEGQWAAAVPIDRLSSAGYTMRPGDYADIMMTFMFYQIDEQFQTYLQNSAVFFLEDVVEAAEGEEVTLETLPEVFVISPYGRFEELPTGDVAHIGPSETQRPIPVSIILQNARIIQVGDYVPESVQPPTATPEVAEDGATPTPGAIPPTATPSPDVVLVALTPQQQLFLKYALESNADIDFALRGVNDNQIFSVENVDLTYLLSQFGIEVPPNFNYSVDNPGRGTIEITPTPSSAESTEPPGGG